MRSIFMRKLGRHARRIASPERSGPMVTKNDAVPSRRRNRSRSRGTPSCSPRRVGVITWIAAAAHEIPQELGDFGILVRGGWGKLSALVANFVSAATIVPGALLAYYLSADFDITFLLSFAAGNFLYIAASDLIPEVKHDSRLQNNLIHFAAFASGVGLILVTRAVFHT